MSINNKLEHDLKSLTHQFEAGFEQKVMNTIQSQVITEAKVVKIWSNRFALAAAACVAVLFLSTYFNHGTITQDGLIGLEEFNSLEVGETYITYNELYNE